LIPKSIVFRIREKVFHRKNICNKILAPYN
jgi:hypothetical protein